MLARLQSQSPPDNVNAIQSIPFSLVVSYFLEYLKQVKKTKVYKIIPNST